MKRPLYVTLYGFIFLLSACQDVAEPPLSNDTTPPTLVSQTPLPNADNIAADTVISATFSEAMSASSVTAESVKVVDSTGATLERTATLADDTLTVQLSTVPKVPTKLTLELNGLSDVAGNALLVTAWSWFVPASPYGSPEFLAEPSAITEARLEERPVQVASDREGNLAVAWLNAGNLLVKSWTANLRPEPSALGWSACGRFSRR
jgi:hypothetical protein